MLTKFRCFLAVVLCLLLLTSTAFADVVISTATFEINGIPLTYVTISQGESKTLSVTFTGTGSIEGNDNFNYWFTYPTKIAINHAGDLSLDSYDTKEFAFGETGFTFNLEVCAASDADLSNVSIDLFEGLPRMGSGGGTGTFISFGEAIKIKGDANAVIDVIDGGIEKVDITVEKAVSSNLPNLNNEVTFTVTATNNGPDAATGVVVEDTLPSGLAYVSSNPADDGAAVDVNGKVISWNIGDLAVGQTEVLEITARVSSAGTLVNVAEVTGVNQCDINTSNDCASASIDVGKLLIKKFYDGNVDGLNNTETELTDWMFKIEYDLDGAGWATLGNIDSGTPVFFNAGTEVRVTEGKSALGSWVNTTDTVQTVLLTKCDTNLEFGNVSLGAGGGKTLGFWSNKNGQSYISAEHDFELLKELSLRSANGGDFDPVDKAELRKWLLNGDAVNMSYMLSVQLAAMELNVHNGFVNGGAMVYAPALDFANSLGFVSINELMNQANSLLAGSGLVGAGSAERAQFEAVKDALDRANNNLIFVQTAPGSAYGNFTY